MAWHGPDRVRSAGKEQGETLAMPREFTVEAIPRGERRLGVYPTAVPGLKLSIAFQVQDDHRYLEIMLFELPADRMVASYATWIELEIEQASLNPHEHGIYLAVGDAFFSVTPDVAEHIVRDFAFPFVVPDLPETD